MTFSIVARCPHSGQFGVAAVTAVPAVGKLVTHAWPGAGAVATQARLNPYLGFDGISLLRAGRSAQQTLAQLRRADPRIEARQFAVVDRAGTALAFTGAECLHWAGHREHDGFSVQGNRLVGPQVLEETASAFMDGADRSLADRFVVALVAGVAAGGDREGERSATVYVMGAEEYPLWDIRVDDHDDPVGELRRLHGVFARQLAPEIARMPTRANPAGAAGECDV